MQLVGLGERGTRAVFAAALGLYASAERTLAADVQPMLQGDMLPSADRGFVSYELWQATAAAGARLLWRALTRLIRQHQRRQVRQERAGYLPRGPSSTRDRRQMRWL